MSLELTSLILSLLEELGAALGGVLGQASCRSVLICTSTATFLASSSSTFYLLASRMSVSLIILVRGGCLRSEFWGIGTHQIMGCFLVPRLIRSQVSASSPSTLAAATPLGLLLQISMRSLIFRVLRVLLAGLVLLLLPLRLGAGASSSASILLGRSWCCLDLR